MHSLKQIFIPHHHNSYRPHLIRRHGLAFALMLVLGIQVISGIRTSSADGRVLGYASNVSISGLLSATNSERAAAGKSALSLSNKLNSAAQGKANHMISGDYWAHTSPDGVTPWYWFDWAGYDYKVAGENLAYGFDTSNGVVNGWMNSPSHRDNMLNGAFENVGFGIANGSDYQGGTNTVVVAHYGDPAVLSDTSSGGGSGGGSGSSGGGNESSGGSEPSSQPTQQSYQPPVSEPVETTEEPAKSEQPQEEKEEEQEGNENEQKDEKQEDAILVINRSDIDGDLEVVGTASSGSTRISNLQAMLSGQAGWALYTTSLIAVSLGFVYAYRHLMFIHRVVIKGEHFIVSHPMLEASIIYALIWLLLAGTFGNVL